MAIRTRSDLYAMYFVYEISDHISFIGMDIKNVVVATTTVVLDHVGNSDHGRREGLYNYGYRTDRGRIRSGLSIGP